MCYRLVGRIKILKNTHQCIDVMSYVPVLLCVLCISLLGATITGADIKSVARFVFMLDWLGKIERSSIHIQ